MAKRNREKKKKRTRKNRDSSARRHVRWRLIAVSRVAMQGLTEFEIGRADALWSCKRLRPVEHPRPRAWGVEFGLGGTLHRSAWPDSRTRTTTSTRTIRSQHS